MKRSDFGSANMKIMSNRNIEGEKTALAHSTYTHSPPPPPSSSRWISRNTPHSCIHPTPHLQFRHQGGQSPHEPSFRRCRGFLLPGQPLPPPLLHHGGGFTQSLAPRFHQLVQSTGPNHELPLPHHLVFMELIEQHSESIQGSEVNGP